MEAKEVKEMTGTDEMARSEQELGACTRCEDWATGLMAWWERWRERRRERSERRRMERCRRKAGQMVQLTEYGGEIYVSFGGRPLVPSEDIIGDICETVDDSRRAYASYLYDHDMEG